MQDSFITIAVYQFSSEAHIIRGKLRSEGVNAFLVDDLTIDVDPLISNAIGGVKLKVPYQEKDKALEVLNSISKNLLTDEGKVLECPRCGSDKVYFLSGARNFIDLIVFLISVLPFFVSYRYRCENCKNSFK